MIDTTNNVKRQRFIKIVERRVNKILDGLDDLSKCANKRNYEYDNEDVKRVFKEIERKVKDTKFLFQNDAGNKKRFRLGQ